MTDQHERPAPDEERRDREAGLDTTIAQSFPASDPPSSIPNPREHEPLDEEDKKSGSRRD